MAKSMNEFLALVRDSVEGQAKRKNYTASDNAEGPNQLMEVGRLLNYEPQHGIGEIVFKCAEYLRNPREVLLIKIAGWAAVLWLHCHQREEKSWDVLGSDRAKIQEELLSGYTNSTGPGA